MALAELLSQYGPLGIIAGAALTACWMMMRATVTRLQSLEDWTRDVLVGLVRDTGAELAAVRGALEGAPCRLNGANVQTKSETSFHGNGPDLGETAAAAAHREVTRGRE